MRYGDLSYVKEPIGNFEGAANSSIRDYVIDKVIPPTTSNVNSRDVKLRYLETRAKRLGTE